ncbi:unnamed protein product, partial [Closterium sp. NIES-53]
VRAMASLHHSLQMLLPRSTRMLQATKSAPRASLLCLVISIALSAPCAVRGAPQGPAATSIAAALSSASSPLPSQSFNVSLLVLNATGLLANLPSLAPLTLFAPTDAAWRAAFHALALPYLSFYIPFPGAPGSPGSPGSSSSGAGSSDAANPGGIAQPTLAPSVAPAAGGASGGASAAMIPGLPQVDLPLPGVPDVAIPGIPGVSDGLNSTIPVDNITIPMPDLNTTMPNITMPNPFLAALSAVFSGDGTPASLAALAKERPEALKAVSKLLAYHVATTALNAAAIAAQFTADAGNLTTVNGQGLWINYNSSESAALLNAYSPAQRALMSEGASVGYDDTVDYPNDTTVAANGTVIFDPFTSPINVDSDGNTYFANGTVVSANGTDMVPTDMPANIQVDPIPGVMGGWGNWGNWSVDAQQQWWGNATEWMNGVVPGLNVTASEYLAWLNSSPWVALSDAMWEQAGSDRNVARVVRADLMDSAGMVVHGVDGVLFPHIRDFPISPKGDGGGAEGDVPVPIAIPVVAPGGVANDSANDAGMNGTATGGQPDDSAVGGAGAPAAAGSSSNGSNSSNSGGQDASKSAASGTPAPPAGSPPAGKAQSKAAAVPLLLTAALSLVALL